jgi:cysteine synthase
MLQPEALCNERAFCFVIFDLWKENEMPEYGHLCITEVDTHVLPAEWAERFTKHKVKLHYIDLTRNPAGNGKFWPAREILKRAIEQYPDAVALVDSTSGNYGKALAVALELYRKEHLECRLRIIMAVPKGLLEGKRKLLLDCGIELLEAKDSLDTMKVAREYAKENGFVYTGQYWNPANSDGWNPVSDFIANTTEVGVIAWGVGSGGGASNVLRVLKERFEERSFGLWGVAVAVEDGSAVGGVRGEKQLEPGTLPWWRFADEVRFVNAEKSREFTSSLWKQKGVYVGTSTGFAVQGACFAIRNLVMLRRLNRYRAADGFVHVLVPSLDLCWPYREEYERMGIPFPEQVPQ